MIKGKEILIGRSLALLGGAMNILSGKAFETLPRALGGLLSIIGNISGVIAEKLFIEIAPSAAVIKESKIEKIKTWAAGHQLVINNVPKITGAALLVVSGLTTGNTAETAAGSLYVIANSLELKGEQGRKIWLTSTALSSLGGGAMIFAGISHRDPAQTLAGASYFTAAILLALANPQKYKSFRERIEAERKNVKEIEI